MSKQVLIYHDFQLNPGETMQWRQGQACSHCCKPTVIEFHRFSSGNKTWEYYAPLYHNVAEKLGFCGPSCVMGWIESKSREF